MCDDFEGKALPEVATTDQRDFEDAVGAGIQPSRLTPAQARLVGSLVE